MTLLEQALKAKDEGRFEEWFLALPPERKEALVVEMRLEDYRARNLLPSTINLNYSTERGWYTDPSETK